MTERAPDSLVIDDTLLPFQVDALDVRGRIVRLGPLISSLLDLHSYPAPISRVLAEAVALTALLGSVMKTEGRFTLQTQTNGILSMLVVDMQTPDKIRACAQFDADRLALLGPSPSTAKLLGHGSLAMIIEQGGTRYQGLVALEGIGLEEAAHLYFQQSEQIPTLVRLAVAEEFDRSDHGPEHSWRAGGFLVQFLPSSPDRHRHVDLDPGDAPKGFVKNIALPDDLWIETQSLVATLEDIELIDPQLSSEVLLYRLFHERGVKVFSSQPLMSYCTCSQERIFGVLANFSAEDRADMEEHGKITVTCEFCSKSFFYRLEQFL